jgi:hypothetical protein
MKYWVIKSSLMISMVLGLSACMSSVDLAAQRHERQVCEHRCDTRAQQCQTQCRDNRDSCAQQVQANTKKNYKAYRNGRCIEGKIPILELQSFRDPLQCLKKTCDCADDYRVCKRACSGIIDKRLQHTIN